MLVDCDNFFVSCERIFKPSLKGRPVVVLSNNDGCVVSRSYEAKALQIPMGCPFFKIADFFKSRNGIALSSNHELYADISGRLMSFLKNYFKQIEIYSIDEAFIRLNDCEATESTAAFVRNALLRHIGIPVSIGIAPSKTLAKIAGILAKKKAEDKWQILTDPDIIDRQLQLLKVADIWGIGRRNAEKLNFLGIFNALELKNTPLGILRTGFGLPIIKTVMELNGNDCIGLEPDRPQQSIMISRSFESEISSLKKLKQIIAEFTDHACLCLRRQNSLSGGIVTLLETNRFRRETYYSNQILISLPRPSNYTASFIRAAHRGLEQIFRPQYAYKRAGIILVDICGLEKSRDLFANTSAAQKEQRLMAAVDELNHRLGKKTLFFGSQTIETFNHIKKAPYPQKFMTFLEKLPAVK